MNQNKRSSLKFQSESPEALHTGISDKALAAWCRLSNKEVVVRLRRHHPRHLDRYHKNFKT
jgi:hypothetical protein